MALQCPGATISGDTLAIYNSSAFAERGFCSKCGSHIFHRPKLGDELAVSAGLFDSDGFYLDREIFVDAKPPFYRFDSDARQVTTLGMIREWLPKLARRFVGKAFGRRP
jgi:hypothetical protein